MNEYEYQAGEFHRIGNTEGYILCNSVGFKLVITLDKQVVLEFGNNNNYIYELGYCDSAFVPQTTEEDENVKDWDEWAQNVIREIAKSRLY